MMLTFTTPPAKALVDQIETLLLDQGCGFTRHEASGAWWNNGDVEREPVLVWSVSGLAFCTSVVNELKDALSEYGEKAIWYRVTANDAVVESLRPQHEHGGDDERDQT